MSTLVERTFGAGGAHERLMNRAAAVTVTLTRAGDAGTFGPTTVYDAIVGNTIYKRNGVGAAAIEFGERDYFIPVASYSFDGLGVVAPAEGDLIKEGDQTYEVLPVAGEPAKRYSGQGLARWRIHVKRVTDDTGR